MPDLFVDDAALRRARRDMDDIKALMERPGDTMRSAASSATGIARLRHRLEEFGSEWDHGIDKMGKYAEGCGEAIDNVLTQFDTLDRELARALEEAE